MIGLKIKDIWSEISQPQRVFLQRSLIAIILWIIFDSLISLDNHLTNFVSYGSEYVAQLITTCHPIISKNAIHTNNITIEKISLSGCNTNIFIGHACNGKAIIYLYTAFIIASVGYSIRKKIVFCVTGIALISVSNIFRIVALFIIKRDSPTWFDIAHKNIFQILMYVIIIALWMLFLNRIPKK